MLRRGRAQRGGVGARVMIVERVPCRGLARPLGLAFIAAVALLEGCRGDPHASYQGYVEGEFVHIASPVAGRLEKLLVQRGSSVQAGTPLYELESVQETAAKLEAEANLREAQARLADLQKGRRPPEVEVVQAQLAQARVAQEQSAVDLKRQQANFAADILSQSDLDAARVRYEMNVDRVRELESQVDVSRLPARGDQIQAQTSQVAAAKASLEQAQWRLDQKRASAQEAALVYDTLYREGEWVPEGSPVVRMLPPRNVKVRFFVPETVAGGIQPGRKAIVRCDGCPSEVPATVSYVSAESEYTPPVIYSNETRSKLVFMIEARPSAEDAPRLRPGQPVEVVLP